MRGVEQRGPWRGGRRERHGLGVEIERPRLFDRLLRHLLGVPAGELGHVADRLLDGGR